MDEIDARLARINARLASDRADCPVCEAFNERAAILEFDANLPRAEADRLARDMHPCGRHR
jgi:hypothetical protein